MMLVAGMVSGGPFQVADATLSGPPADASLPEAGAAATFPGRNGRIAYTKGWEERGSPGPDARFDVFTVRPNGTGNKRLTFSENSFGPMWSPVGGRIAYERAGAVWVMKADGSGKRRLTTGELVGWMPGGGRLLVVRGLSQPGTTWLLYRLSTGEVEHLPIDLPVVPDPAGPPYQDFSEWSSVSEPTLSPDGELLALVLSRPDEGDDQYSHDFSSFFTVRLDGTGLTMVGSLYGYDYSWLGWAPTSDRLVYRWREPRSNCLDALHAIRLDGTPGSVSISQWCNEGSPAWSPNGRKIAFTGGGEGVLPAGIHVANLDGSRTRTVLRNRDGVYRGELDWRALR